MPDEIGFVIALLRLRSWTVWKPEERATAPGYSRQGAEQAEQENFPSVARLFRAIAYAEQVHAANISRP